MASVGGTIGPLQLGILAILILMTLTGLYYTGTGETIPNSVMFSFAVGMVAVVIGVFQSFGGFTQAKEEDPEKEAEDLFDKKKEKRDLKRSKKEALKAQEEAELEQERQAKKAAKLQAQKIAKAEAREAEAKRQEEERKKQEEEEKKIKKAKKPKNKKDKKDKETKETKETAPVNEVVETQETKDSEGAEDWVVQPSQKEIREAKKANRDEATTEVEMLVNSKHYPGLIGQEGSVRAKIEETCSVKLTFPRKNSGEEKIKLEGTSRGITLARQIINEIIDNGYSSTLDSSATSTTVSVPASVIGLLLANTGANMKSLRAKTGIRIEIPEKESRVDKPKASTGGKKGASKEAKEEDAAEPPKPPVDVTLVGDKDGVSRAVEALHQLIKDGYSDLTHENHTKTTVAFPGSLIGTLMRNKGEQLQKIQKSTGARIQLPPQEKDNKPALVEVTLLGQPDQVERARREIVAFSTDFVTHEIDIPDALKFLFFTKSEARQGAVQSNFIQDLQKTTGTRVDLIEHLWDPTLKTVSISGGTKAIQDAIKKVETLIEKQEVATQEIPTERIPFLIGKGGETLKKTQADAQVRIDISNHEWDSTIKVVTIVGKASNIIAAQEAIKKALEPRPREPKPERPPREDRPPRERRERNNKKSAEVAEVASEELASDEGSADANTVAP